MLAVFGWVGRWGWGGGLAYNHKDPEGVVEEYYRGGHEHGEADEAVELAGVSGCLASFGAGGLPFSAL